MIKGVIFDMDGLMLDTEKLYLHFWIKAAESFGYVLKVEQVLSIRSMASKYAEKKFIGFFGEACDYYAIRQKRRELMEEYIDEHGIEKKKGLDELLNYLKQKGCLMAVATATDEERTRKYLTGLKIDSYFSTITCASMVENGKPEPDIYIEAASRLGLNPDECLALEDSPNGVMSAYRAGCHVIMVPDLDMPQEDTKKMLYAQVESLDKVIDYIE